MKEFAAVFVIGISKTVPTQTVIADIGRDRSRLECFSNGVPDDITPPPYPVGAPGRGETA
jgi:hypothetical protein